MVSDRIRLTVDTANLAASKMGQAANALLAFAAAMHSASPPGPCPPHGTERCEHCGSLPIIRIWKDREGALWDEHPGNLISRRDHPDGGDQEISAALVRETLGPLMIVWHEP